MDIKKDQPENLKLAYTLAYNKACEEFQRWDPMDMATSSDSSFSSAARTISIRYVDEDYKVSFPSGEVSYADKTEFIPITVKIVLLHYLIRANGQPLKNSWISFKEISEGGMLYLEPFTKRVTNYLLGIFGNEPQTLLQAGRLLGGEMANCGDYGIRINVLPRLPITYALWAGDEEFAPRATVLFDATAPFYLPTEDIVVAAAFCIGKLARMAKTIENSKIHKSI